MEEKNIKNEFDSYLGEHEAAIAKLKGFLKKSADGDVGPSNTEEAQQGILSVIEVMRSMPVALNFQGVVGHRTIGNGSVEATLAVEGSGGVIGFREILRLQGDVAATQAFWGQQPKDLIASVAADLS